MNILATKFNNAQYDYEDKPRHTFFHDLDKILVAYCKYLSWNSNNDLLWKTNPVPIHLLFQVFEEM